jgi:Asp-tRNA(Asn)/Glu-tRNA(Gln) amidotransferase A subunit family amidase
MSEPESPTVQHPTVQHPTVQHPSAENPTVHSPDGAAVPDGVLDAFWEYERALTANDLDALDALFAPGPDTLRGDAAGLLVGKEAIRSFRSARGGSPARDLVRVEVRPIDEDAALIVAVTAPHTGGRGQQTQLWRRLTGGWVVEAAHVTVPAPALATAVWRVVGAPLVAPGTTAPPAGEPSTVPQSSLPLSGMTVAVKDLFQVAGFAVGAGVPRYLAEQAPATANAAAVDALLGAGAAVQGIAQTDEFAFSIAGKNPHYGTPPNPAVIGGIPGGSSSGPAAAVALGQASIGLGTDTGGSIRVPASYQGLWGLRTTHGVVSVDGLLGLAATFDTVGWLTRDAATLRAAATASIDAHRQRSLDTRFAIAPTLTAQADDDVRVAFVDRLAALADAGLLSDIDDVDLGDIDKLFETFRTVQAAEAWREHGDWIDAHPGALGDDIAARFAWASTIDRETESLARSALMVAEARISATLDDRILLLPSASSAAPSVAADAATIELARARTLRLTCIAGIARMPALSVPALRTPDGPAGLCLVGPRFGDLSLIDAGERFFAALQLSATP